MSFKDEAREILKHQPQWRVDNFLDAVREDYAGGLDENNPLIHEKYYPSYYPIISDSELALKGLVKILNKPMYKGKQDELYEAIKIIQGALDVNVARKPKGAPGKLNLAEKHLLRHLQEEFRRCFPDDLTAEYKRGTLLRKLGEALLSMSLTDTTDKQIAPEKF
jgi:hypothetical protein